MSGTRSHSRTEQVTEPSRKVLLVAFGSPSDPDPQEQATRQLADAVAHRLPGWTIGSATLAKRGSLQSAIADLGDPIIYPFFMAQGFILEKMLMPRVRKAGLTVLRPFGVEPALVDHAAMVVERTLKQNGMNASSATVIVAAHGSAICQPSQDSAQAFASALQERLALKACRCGFLEQEPFISDAVAGVENAICLTFFNLKAGHVLSDIPKALDAAGFNGPVIDAFVTWPETAELIAHSLTSQSQHFEAAALATA
ncbi:MAG: hypothetical protein WBO55_19385 [Rhizobiaceae bacterium]